MNRLFTPRFFIMCGFSFAVFLAALQLLPAAPFHILDLGGTTFQSGLFLAFLTYASACSAPLTGALGDRLGRRRVMITAAVVMTALSMAYGVITSIPLLLAVALVHGVFWSSLLAATGAYMVSGVIPETRRAEGIGYWGLSSVIALAVAPPIGFWVYRFGWLWLCLGCAALNFTMAMIAWKLLDDAGQIVAAHPVTHPRDLVDVRALVLSVTMFLCTFGYGAVTSFSALFAESQAIVPKSIFLTAMALAILVCRPLVGARADRIGYKKVLVPALGLDFLGLAILSATAGRAGMIAGALTFGAGFGILWPVFSAYLLQGVDPARRGAMYGAMLAAVDTGIGTGSMSTGWLIDRAGFSLSFGVGAAVAALAIPYFLLIDRVHEARHRHRAKNEGR
ncbi:MAG: MFS transporter [Acidobacteria bacterium]|nr:MFS transporter [Acidobacteriota bacterium]